MRCRRPAAAPADSARRAFRTDGDTTVRIRVIGSGSSGNAILVHAGGRTILIDAGVAVSRIEAGCRAEGIAPESLDAVFLSHEHSDHAGAAPLFTRRHRVPAWCSEETHG